MSGVGDTGTGAGSVPSSVGGEGPRIDKWLWFARFFKTRSLAQKVCAGGKLRVNREPTAKGHYRVRIGDVLTFPQGSNIRVVRVVAFGERRGPASEARALYEDLAPLAPKKSEKEERALEPATPGWRPQGAGRPTKSERRAIDRLRSED